MEVYQIWYETSVGPTFATVEEAEAHLDERDSDWGGNWRELRRVYGYPRIDRILLGNENHHRDR